MTSISRFGMIALLATSGFACGVHTPAVLAQAASPSAIATPKSNMMQTTFGQSLDLRADRIVADSTHTAYCWLGQTNAAAYTSKGALKIKFALQTAEGEPKPVKDLGAFTIFGGNLASDPFPFPVNLSGVPDGNYRYAAEVWDGDVKLAVLEKKVVLVAGLDEKQADFARRLAKITDHDSARASILYPIDLARVINSGRRIYGATGASNPEFGLSQAGALLLYDFSAGLKKSGELLAALESGRDPVWRSGGEKVRHYYMPEAGEILPYHVFVPSAWDGHSPLPLVFIFHGNTRDQDFYFDRDERIIPKTAEKHGYMVVAPLGYSPNGGYNYAPFRSASSGPRGLAVAAATPQNFGPPATGKTNSTGFGGVNGSVTPAPVRAEWSEQDAMHVFDLIRQEYPIDRKRTFLFGYSGGGQAAHYLGQKFAENWTAIAIGGSNAEPGDTYAFDRLQHISILLFSGGADQPTLKPLHAMFEAMQQHGIKVALKEYPGVDHAQAPSAAIRDIFDFFEAHPGQN